MAKNNTKNLILNYLLKNGRITTWDAITEFGCTRLAHYIWLLKKDGYVFDTEDVGFTNKYGNTSHYREYILLVK